MPPSIRAAWGLGIVLGAVCAPVAFGQAKPGDASTMFAVGSAGPYAVTPQDDPQVPPWAGREALPAEPPGWFDAVTAGLVKPHASGSLAGGPGLPFGDLDWTVMPRIEIGYRLPDGAGDLRLGYQELTASGSDGTFPGGLSTRLNLHAVDFDYVSTEWLVEQTPDLFRGLRAVVGLRLASSDLHSTGLLWDFRNQSCGIGPRFGLEWSKPISTPWPLEAYVRAEATGLATQTKQTIGLAAAVPWQWSGAAAVLTEVGVAWWPAGPDRLRVVAGYQLEQCWNLGRTDAANVDLSVHGLFLRAEWRY